MIPPDRHRVDGRDWTLVRAWPRSLEAIPLELAAPAGGQVVGQWFADVSEADREARRTPGSRVGDDGRLVLQPGGVDRKLGDLAAVVAAGGALLAHRPNRRAVVRTAAGRFLKLTRPGRAFELARRHELLAAVLAGQARVPPVLSVTDDRLELGPLHGDEPLDHAGRASSAWERGWEATGACLAQLATGPRGLDLPTHDATAEVEVTETWVHRAVAAGRLPPRDLGPSLLPLHDGAESPTGLAHRDLHDGQLLFGSGRPGILDADTLAYAEPALDLANLLVHLDLRVDQGRLSSIDRHRAAAALLVGAAPDDATRQRLPHHQLACRLRLAGVYAFRPRWHGLARRWFEAALAEGADPAFTARGAARPEVVNGLRW